MLPRLLVAMGGLTVAATWGRKAGSASVLLVTAFALDVAATLGSFGFQLWLSDLSNFTGSGGSMISVISASLSAVEFASRALIVVAL